MDPFQPNEVVAPAWLRRGVARLEGAVAADRVAEVVDKAARPLSEGRAGQVLRGEWLGHALHPVLTDLPLGCWLGAGLLDLVGGRRGVRPAHRLVALGLVAAVPTALAGLAEMRTIRDERYRRVAAVHAVGNTAVVGLYLRSWTRRRRSPLGGIMWGLAGGVLAWVTGYLGGHLSFGRGVGVGSRGLDTGAAGTSTVSSPTDDEVSVVEAARLLTVPPEQVAAMVEEGLLTAEGAGAGEMRLRRSEVMAARQLGG